MHGHQYGADTLAVMPTLRMTARAVVPALVIGLVLLASPALADVPDGWAEPEAVTLMRALLVYVFAPAGLVLLITLLSLAPSLAKGERPGVGPAEDQWFGGPRDGAHQLESRSSGSTTGGASGSW